VASGIHGNIVERDLDMTAQHFDLAEFLQNVLDRLSQNLTIAKLLILLHLDPNNVTYDAILQRVGELVLANINIPNACALVAAGFYAATFLMPRMIPLRVFGILSALFFMAYGLLGGAITTFLMYLLLLPINALRLYQMLGLVKKARTAAEGDMSIEWLKSYMNLRKYKKGDVLFRKGQRADEMLLTVSGKFLVRELGIELPPGRIVGEIGFLTPQNKRTQSVECVEDGAVMTISYDRLLEIYFEQPDFGYYLLRLVGSRLMENNARLEAAIEGYKAKLALPGAGQALAAVGGG
jgi:Cyclic nucleotide-binding domain